MKSLFSILLTIILTFLSSSCSTMRKVGLGVVSPMFSDASKGFEKEGNWQAFKDGIPGNLKLLDGLLEVRSDDVSLLSAAIKGNAGYAFSIYETLYLDHKLAEEDESIYKDQAISYYAKALSYGFHFLKLNDISFYDLQKANRDPDGIKKILSRIPTNLESIEALAYTAQAMGSLINLQRDKMTLIAQLPIVKGMFDWVCLKDPNVGHGVCDIFMASYMTSRPKMLGGDPEKGKKLFEKAIKERPHNWLIRVTYLEHYIIPMSDEDLYKEQKIQLKKYVQLHKQENNWNPTLKRSAAFKNQRLRLFQAIAIKRFKTIVKYEDDLF